MPRKKRSDDTPEQQISLPLPNYESLQSQRRDARNFLTAEIKKKGGTDQAIARSTNRIYDRAYQMTPRELYETYGAEDRDSLPEWIQRELQIYETAAGIHLQHHAMQSTEQPHVDNEIVEKVDNSAQATNRFLNWQKRGPQLPQNRSEQQ